MIRNLSVTFLSCKNAIQIQIFLLNKLNVNDKTPKRPTVKLDNFPAQRNTPGGSQCIAFIKKKRSSSSLK